MLSRARLRAVMVALAIGVLPLTAPAVAGANPRCGSTLAHSVRLTANMICRISDGLDVGRSGITSNLDGHTIKGQSGSSSHYGIYNSGYRDVTIENGTVRNFEDGIHEEHSNGSKIVRVTVHDSYEAGILYQLSKHGVIDHVGVFGTRQGIFLYENRLVNVTDSTSNHNLIYGLYDYGSASKVNHVNASFNDDYGFYLEYPVAYTSSEPYTLENSTGNDNGYAGFYVYNNVPPHSEYQADLIGNTANDNEDYGLYAEYWAQGRHNHAAGNSVSNCYRVPGCS
jgi:Right handed beta helix region